MFFYFHDFDLKFRTFYDGADSIEIETEIGVVTYVFPTKEEAAAAHALVRALTRALARALVLLVLFTCNAIQDCSGSVGCNVPLFPPALLLLN